MNRTNLLVALFLGMVAHPAASPWELAAASPADSSRSDRPNIIFVLADDQGWNGTSVQMHPDVANSKSDFYKTPNLERLASRGVRFSQAYAPGPMCSPTRASLQTGKSPAQLAMTNIGRGGRPALPSQKLVPAQYTATLATEEVTIGEVLQQAGYATAWFGKWHLGGEGPASHGYDESDGPTGNADGVIDNPDNPKDIFGISERGIAFIEKNVKAGKPFYLQLWHYAVHGPIQTRRATKAAYEEKTKGELHQSAAFAGMTEDLDTGVGMIMETVQRLAIADNTYIVYMSDHGAGLNLSSNAPLHRGKGTLWEGGVRVPLIISGPGVARGAFCHAPAVGWDLFPTFCELAEVESPLPQGLEGVSLKPLLNSGKGSIDRPVYPLALHFPHYGNAAPHSTIQRDGFKLVKFYESNELRLFDLNRDIGEQNDLSEADPSRTAELHRLMTEYFAKVNAEMPSLNPEFDPGMVAVPGRRPAGRRGGSRRERIAERQKELAALEEALDRNNLKRIGELITQMTTALQDAPARPPGRRQGNPDGPSTLERRKQELAQLEQAHRRGDLDQLRKLVADSKQRLLERARPPTETSSEGPRRRRQAPEPSDQ